MDQNTLKIILFFNRSLASGKNKKYLIAVFKHQLQSCKEFFSEHFAENRMTL